jgi:Flp pilus assembly protein TadD
MEGTPRKGISGCALLPSILLGGLLLFGVPTFSAAETTKVSLQGPVNVEVTPQDRAFSLNELGVELVLKGDKERGHEALREAAKLDPKNPTIFYNLAGLYLSRGDIRSALEAVNRCIALRPEDLSFLHRLGEIHFAAGNYADAAEVFEQIAGKNPKFNEVLFHLGTVYAMQERWELAEDSLRKAVKLYPSHSSLETNLANVLIMQQKFAEAASLLESVERREPSAETSLALGIALEGAGKLEQAASSYRRAKELGSTDPQLAQRIAALEKAK